jgi:alpha-tubulin suppressor-like RCC1 family protein
MRILLVAALGLAGCHDAIDAGRTQSAVRVSTWGGRAYSTLAVGYAHSCALGRNGAVYCWGNNLEGELGDGTAVVNRLTPVQVTGLGSQVFVGAANSTSCSVGADGSARCWGYNNQGQLGMGTTWGPVNGGYNTPQQVRIAFGNSSFPIGQVVEIAVGDLHACARDAWGGVWCWGYNLFGQLGDGTTTNRSYATFVPGVSGVIALAAGGDHTCALLADRTVACWGYNGDGELGNGTQTSSATPVVVPGLDNVTAISAMEWGMCALLADGTARCWGDNGLGQMGNGTAGGPQLSPTPVYLYGIASLARGASNSTMCAVLFNGGGQCWGWNGNGETGSGTTSTYESLPVPMAPTGGSPPHEMAMGFTHGCARTADGNLWCWGFNGAGQLGDNTTNASSVPVYNFIPQWMSPSQRIAATAGPFQNTTCAISSAFGQVYCWGYGGDGELGNGTTTNVQLTPVAVSGLDNVIAITAGQTTFQALRGDGSVWCWGNNVHHECAANSNILTTPFQVPGISGAVAICQGCAVLYDGRLMCWGPNSYGQVGINNTVTPQTVPVQVMIPQSPVIAVAGQNTRCAVVARDFQVEGNVLCWGANSEGEAGQNPVNNVIPSPNPILLHKAVALSGDNGHKCALKNDGTVWCWGSNDDGELGDGTTTDRYTPTRVPAISGAIAVVATRWAGNAGFSCAILGNGTQYCWGGNDYGQLGLGFTSTPRLTPVQVSGMSNTLQVALASQSTFALRGDGTLWAWGDNTYGELGFGIQGGLYTLPAQVPFSP